MRMLVWLALLTLTECRAERPESAVETVEASPQLWFDSAGEPGRCDVAETGCTSFKDEKAFVDQCVAQGFGAKTCGCKIRCSGKIVMAGGASPSPQAQPIGMAQEPCSEADLAYLGEVVRDARPGTTLSRCIESHVCGGDLGKCTEVEEVISGRLRLLARRGCEREIVGAFCRDGYADSLQCPEADIRKLSIANTDMAVKDGALRRCIRAVACGGNAGVCSEAALKEAKSIKVSLDRDGCEYWLRTFCSLGAN